MTKQAIIRSVSLQRAIVFNMLAPIAVYQVATSRGLSELQGLLLASIFPRAPSS